MVDHVTLRWVGLKNSRNAIRKSSHYQYNTCVNPYTYIRKENLVPRHTTLPMKLKHSYHFSNCRV